MSKALSKDFTQGNAVKQLLFFTLPFMTSNALQEGISQIPENNDIRRIRPREIPKYDFCPADKDILEKLMMYKKTRDGKA